MSERSHAIELTVPFHDVDPMQVVWHGHYLKYFEAARTALFDQFGLDLYSLAQECGCVFPVVRSAVKHTHPLRYRDRFRCLATLVPDRAKIIVEFELTLLGGGQRCASGRTEQVALKMPEMTLQFALPEPLRRCLCVD
jgi:acyl-CoA thioester hydrolase